MWNDGMEGHMRHWEDALRKFLAEWLKREDVIGALVCGSHVTGSPSPRSDIDVHIVLTDDSDWRERGNRYVDGFLIEYFANPPRQIRAYFEEDFRDRRTMSHVQFMTGRALFDPHGVVEQLRREAREWKAKTYDEIAPSLIELKKYGLWDAYDNLSDCFESGRRDFDFVYYQSLYLVFDEYCAILNIESIPFYQVTRYLTDPSYLSKYLKSPFPDPAFARLFMAAVEERDRGKKPEAFRLLVEHVFRKTGGFDIDGWKVRTPVVHAP
jgi:predicted nucleotidyltransferase